MVKETTLLEKIWQNSTKEREVIKELEKENGQSWEEDKIVYMDGKIYMPNNWKLQKKILQENHDPANIGYPGQHQIMKLIKRNY